MNRKKVLLYALFTFNIVSFILIYNLKTIKTNFHKSQRLIAASEIFEFMKFNLEHSKIPSSLESFHKHQDALVDLKHFEYEIIPCKNIEFPSMNSRDLFTELENQTEIEDGYFEMNNEKGHENEIRLWGTDDQLLIMKNIIAFHDQKTLNGN